jgi:TetR/AcrR family transcriptional regulator, ethionamide resistance regulator
MVRMAVGETVTAPSGTREVILDAAQEFLVHKRLRDMTVSALMEPIPVTREAFYKHFNSRYDVVAALLGRFTAEVADDFGIWLQGNDPARDVPAMFDAASHTYLRRASLLRAVVDAAPLDPDLEAVWQAFLGHFIDAAADRIRADQDLGIANRSVDARLAASALIHLVERMITQELVDATPPSREQVVDVLTHTTLGLVYTSPTRHTEEPGPPHRPYG